MPLLQLTVAIVEMGNAAESATPKLAAAARVLDAFDIKDIGEVTNLAVAGVTGDRNLANFSQGLLGGYLDRITQLLMIEKEHPEERQQIEKQLFELQALIRKFDPDFILQSFRRQVEEALRKLTQQQEKAASSSRPGSAPLSAGVGAVLRIVSLPGGKVVIDVLDDGSGKSAYDIGLALKGGKDMQTLISTGQVKGGG